MVQQIGYTEDMNEIEYKDGEFLYNADAIFKYLIMGRGTKTYYDLEDIAYQNVVNKYNEFIELTANYLHELGYSSAIEYSHMISYMIRNGLLSHNCKIINKALPVKKELRNHLGATIIMGNGVCRNKCNMVWDIFQASSLKIDRFPCIIFDKNGFHDELFHIIPLIEHENNLYGVDVSNDDDLYHFTSSAVMERIGAKEEKLLYQPSTDMILNYKDLFDVENSLKQWDSLANKESTIDKNEYYKNRKKAISRVKNNNKKLIDFLDMTKPLKQEIFEELKKNEETDSLVKKYYLSK